jgi:hypothetical protein
MKIFSWKNSKNVAFLMVFVIGVYLYFHFDFKFFFFAIAGFVEGDNIAYHLIIIF